MTNMRAPVIQPFETVDADRVYNELYEKNKLVVSKLLVFF
jgi:hypothetical protein